MPWYGFIHPILVIFTLIYGILLAQVSLSKLGDWDFPFRRIRNRTIVYSILVIFNIFLGLIVNAILSGKGREIKIFGHIPLAMVVGGAVVLATLITFGRSAPGKISPIMRLHPILILLSLALIMTVGFLTILHFL